MSDEDDGKVTWTECEHFADAADLQAILGPTLGARHAYEQRPGTDENRCKFCDEGIQEHDSILQRFTVTREEMHRMWPELEGGKEADASR
jgi:hypothetical protein